MDVFIKASEYMEIPVRRIDEEPLQKLFVLVRSELNLDLKNIRQEQAKFWKQHPALVKVKYLSDPFFFFSFNEQTNVLIKHLLTHSSCAQTELLIQAQLTRETAALSPNLQRDFRHVLELAPRLLEELMKVFLLLHRLFVISF